MTHNEISIKVLDAAIPILRKSWGQRTDGVAKLCLGQAVAYNPGAIAMLSELLPAGEMVTSWNDAPHRKLADIIDLVKRAIAKIKESGN